MGTHFLIGLEQADLYEGEKIPEGENCLVKYGSIRTNIRVKTYMQKRIDDPTTPSDEIENLKEAIKNYGD